MPSIKRPKVKARPKTKDGPNKVVNAFSSEMLKTRVLFKEKRIDLRQFTELENFANYMYANCLRKAQDGEGGQMKMFLKALAEKRREVLAKQKTKIKEDKDAIKINTFSKKRNINDKAIFDPGIKQIKRTGFVSPSNKGTRIAERTALNISREIQALERNPIQNIDTIEKLKHQREVLIQYMHGRLKRNHRAASFFETLT